MSSDALALVRNIPGGYRSADLRRFFGAFTEAGRFRCFHFRHRPERRAKRAHEDAEEPQAKSEKAKTSCALVKLSEDDREAFVRRFNGQHWIAPNDSTLPARCFVSRIKSPDATKPDTESAASTSQEDDPNNDVLLMPELNPPSVMPQGNVGTPSEYFKDQIQRCTLPPRVIKMLKLSFGESGSFLDPSYKAAKLDYGGGDGGGDGGGGGGGAAAEVDIEAAILARIAPPDPDDVDGDEDNDANVEEWERHEAREDDVTTQERTKPTLLEQEEEVIWEKGGPGLVWYTDDFFWSELAGKDSDELWADDWDVDMEPYYNKEDPGAGDMDARDHALLRLEEAHQAGEAPSVFQKKKQPRQERPNSKRRARSASPPFRKKSTKKPGFAAFEAHTKGIGSKLMRASGWSEGLGLGKSASGLPLPVALRLEASGQAPHRRVGLGRPKVDLTTRLGAREFVPRGPEAPVIKSTADEPDAVPARDRRAEPTRIKTYSWKHYDGPINHHP